MRSKLNKVTSMHLKMSGVDDSDGPEVASGPEESPDTDAINGTDTPVKKKKTPKEIAAPGKAKPVGKPKGLK